MHDKDRIIALILKSYGLNKEIINTVGCGISEPIIAVTDEKNRNWLIESIANFNKKCMDESVKKKDVNKMLGEIYSEFVFMPYPTTRKGHELIDYIAGVMKLGAGSSGHEYAPLLVLAEGKVDRKDIEKYFMVYLESDLSETPVIQLEEVVPADEQVEVVLDKISRLDMHGKTQTEKALFAACCFLYPNLKKQNRLEEYEELFHCVEDLVRQNEEESFIEDLGKMFIMEIYDWKKKTGFCDVFELPNIEMNVISRFDEIILFDSEYFYMKNFLFESIAHLMLNIFPAEVLKSALEEDGILCPESEKTYTTKVNYYNITGNYERLRMLRFRRSAFVQCGELDLIELCLEDKGGTAYGV